MGGVEDEDEDDRTFSLVASGVADDAEPATGVEALCFLADPVPFLLAGVRNGLAGFGKKQLYLTWEAGGLGLGRSGFSLALDRRSGFSGVPLDRRGILNKIKIIVLVLVY
jgi:hypothetical protein